MAINKIGNVIPGQSMQVPPQGALKPMQRPQPGQGIDPGFGAMSTGMQRPNSHGPAYQPQPGGMSQGPVPIGMQPYRGNPVNSYRDPNRPDSIRGQAQLAYNAMHPNQAPQGQGQSGLNPQPLTTQPYPTGGLNPQPFDKGEAAGLAVAALGSNNPQVAYRRR